MATTPTSMTSTMMTDIHIRGDIVTPKTIFQKTIDFGTHGVGGYAPTTFGRDESSSYNPRVSFGHQYHDDAHNDMGHAYHDYGQSQDRYGTHNVPPPTFGA